MKRVSHQPSPVGRDSVHGTRAGRRARRGWIEHGRPGGPSLPLLACAVVLLAVGSFLILPPSAFGQGALTPPGPPAPTMKTLAQIEPRTPISSLPYTISQPGSYYLTTNLTGASGSTGIVVAADSVVIDLNGFTLAGSGGFSGVGISGGGAGLTVRNGTVRNWGGGGIDVSAAYEGRFEKLRVSNGIGAIGLRVGNLCLVRDCTARQNSVGIIVGRRSTVSDCVAESNNNGNIVAADGCTVKDCKVNGGSQGILAGNDATLERCTAYNVLGNGITAGTGSVVTVCIANLNGFGSPTHGIVVGPRSRVADCVASANQGYGILAGEACILRSCVTEANTTGGINAGKRATVSRCSAQSNGGIGIFADFGSTVTDSTASDNGFDGIAVGKGSTVSSCSAQSNGGTGISAGRGSTVSGCTAQSNARHGIYAFDESTVSGCTAEDNGDNGIDAGSDTTVSGCSVAYNGGNGILVRLGCSVFNNTATANGNNMAGSTAGIHATGNGNRIDGNHVFANNGDGILVDNTAVKNFVVRNTSGDNSGYQFRVPGIPGQPPAGANVVGPIVNDATNATANAWANFQQ